MTSTNISDSSVVAPTPIIYYQLPSYYICTPPYKNGAATGVVPATFVPVTSPVLSTVTSLVVPPVGAPSVPPTVLPSKMTETAALSDNYLEQNDLKVAEPQCNETMNYLKSILPEGYECIISDFNEVENPEKFDCTLRLGIFTKKDALKWLKDFEDKSLTIWKVSKTFKESSARIIFKKEFHCHHNTRPRKDSTPSVKHTNCPSKLTITIRQLMKRSKNQYKDTHPCQIFIRFIHNHNIAVSAPSSSIIVVECTSTTEEDIIMSEKSDQLEKRIEEEKNPLNSTNELEISEEDIIMSEKSDQLEKRIEEEKNPSNSTNELEISEEDIIMSEKPDQLEKRIEEEKNPSNSTNELEISEEDIMSEKPDQLEKRIEEEKNPANSANELEISEEDIIMCQKPDQFEKEIDEKKTPSDSINELINKLNKFCEDMKEKLIKTPKVYAEPIKYFLENYEKCKTESSLLSFLYTFGKNSDNPAVKRGRNLQKRKSISFQRSSLSRKIKIGNRNICKRGFPLKSSYLNQYAYGKRKIKKNNFPREQIKLSKPQS